MAFFYKESSLQKNISRKKLEIGGVISSLQNGLSNWIWNNGSYSLLTNKEMNLLKLWLGIKNTKTLVLKMGNLTRKKTVTIFCAHFNFSPF